MSEKRLTLRQAIAFVNSLHKVEGENMVAPQTIYNAINAKKLTRYGKRNKLTLDPEELEALWGPKVG